MEEIVYDKTAKSRLESLLRDLPYPSYSMRSDGTVTIYSGSFAKREYARLLRPLLQSRYPYARLVRCPETVPFDGTLPDVSPVVLEKNVAARKEVVAVSKAVAREEEARQGLDLTATLIGRLKGTQACESLRLETADDFLRRMGNEKPDWRVGWYLRSNVGFDSVNDDTSYDVRLEWDLFKDGYMAAKRRRTEAKRRTLLREWGDERYRRSLAKRRMLGEWKQYRYEALTELEGLRYALNRYLYKDAKLAEERGELTRFDLRDLNATLRESEDRLAWYKAKPHQKMPPNIWRLFAHAENLRLKPVRMLNKTVEDEENVTLPNVRSRWERWSDNLKLNIYAGYRNLYVNQDQALIGFDAKIPLYVDDESERMDAVYYSRLLKRRQEARRLRLDDLREKRADFLYHQRRIRSLTERLHEIETSIKELSEIERSGYAPYAGNLYRKKKEMIRRYVDRVRALLRTRFDALEDLFEMALLADVPLSELYESD
ncbi:MAG: hypothetical protein GXO33_02535 [Epsilonproteobacteria bacterium]|nr:hypothetical protein [Campylobacterota bacterium]